MLEKNFKLRESINGRVKKYRVKERKLKEIKHLTILSFVTEMTIKARDKNEQKRQMGRMLITQNFVLMKIRQIMLIIMIH